MKGLGISAKTMSIIFLVAIIFISLALSGYSFLVSNHPANLPFFAMMEGAENMEDEEKEKEGAENMEEDEDYDENGQKKNK
jgi:flagellar basal body-associated protein FliL